MFGCESCGAYSSEDRVQRAVQNCLLTLLNVMTARLFSKLNRCLMRALSHEIESVFQKALKKNN